MTQPPLTAANSAPFALPDQVSLDRLLHTTVLAALLLLCLAPTRIFLIPFTYHVGYVTYAPPNLIDALLLGLGLALFARAGTTSVIPVTLLGVMALVGAVGLIINGERGAEQVADLLLFNGRIAGGLALGAMLARSRLDAEFIARMFLAGAAIIAGGAIPIALGVVSYDFYTGLRRFGSLGLGPNEAGIVLAGAFNMLIWLTRDRTWPALLAPLLALGIALTGSRIAALLAVVGLVIWIPGLIRLAGTSNRRAKLLVTTLTVVLSAWMVSVFQQQMVSQGTLWALTQRAAETGTDESSTFRLRIYFETIAHLRENPGVLLAGVGGSNVAVEWLLSRVMPLGTYHTHNLALQALTAYGVIGLVAGTVLLLPLVRRSRYFPDDGSRALRAFALTLVGGQIVQYGMWQPKFLFLFTIALGFVTAALKTGVSRPSDTRPLTPSIETAT